ncbi:MAG TPA: M15 family metallopeptidase [Pyrinomonadaceae bacterium]|nr:M15 family metallopeptidase [Pyrinomonadaceae bacterium]
MAIRRTTVHPVVGTVEWETDKLESGRAIRLLNNFEKNIGVVLVPQLVDINDVRTDALQKAGAKFNGKLKFFKPAHAQLLAAFAEVEKAGLKKRLISIAGSFNARLQKRKGGGFVQTPSNHSFGTAFDINSDFNPQGKKPPAVGQPGSVRELVSIFEKHGFRWGGQFPTPDGMHFEVTKILPRETVTVPRPVEVRLNGNPIGVPAIQIEDAVWVGVNNLITLLDNPNDAVKDEVIGTGVTPPTFTVRVNDRELTLERMETQGIGFVRFNDIQPLYSIPFTLVPGDKPRLELTS